MKIRQVRLLFFGAFFICFDDGGVYCLVCYKAFGVFCLVDFFNVCFFRRIVLLRTASPTSDSWAFIAVPWMLVLKPAQFCLNTFPVYQLPWTDHRHFVYWCQCVLMPAPSLCFTFLPLMCAVGEMAACRRLWKSWPKLSSCLHCPIFLDRGTQCFRQPLNPWRGNGVGEILYHD